MTLKSQEGGKKKVRLRATMKVISVEEGAADPVAVRALAMASRLIGVDSDAHRTGSSGHARKAASPSADRGDD